MAAGTPVFFHAGTAVSRLELSLSCENTPEPTMLVGKTDPFIAVFTRAERSDPWTLVGCTDVVPKTATPEFKKPVLADFFFEEVQQLRFQLMYGDETKPPADQVAGGDLMGFYECLMSDLMSTRSKPMKPLTCTKKGKGGEPGLKVLVEEVRAVKGEAQITLWAKKLANRAGWFSTNTAYATLSKLREDGNWVLVARTPTMPKSASPMWPVLTVSMARLCNGDLDRPLRLAVEHQLTASTSSQVGFIDVPVNSLLRPNWSGELKHPRGKPKTCGTIKSMKPVIVERPTFVEYLQGGLEIGLCLAIDFTASNGEPSNPASLHAQIPGSSAPPNAYEQAIAGVGAILAPYDQSGVFCCYGYGAALPPNFVVSQCFALNGNPRSPGCNGIDGVITAYRKALSVVRLSGPTCFAPVLKAACDIAEAGVAATPKGGLSKYVVFLIITDGTIMDMDETIDACVRASRLPMSVVIAGVGSADFTAMHALDSDDRRLAGRNGKAMRDAVNFVPLKDYKGLASGARLARDILQEIPLQVTQYFAFKGIPPPPPVGKAAPAAADEGGAPQEEGVW